MITAEPQLRSALDGMAEELVETRRHLHRNPELSLEEHNTAAFAAKRAEELGFTVRTDVGGTGVVADMEGSGPGPTLMLRADMDALPINENAAGRIVTSDVPGVMHACGHDGHISMLLGAANVLSQLRSEWKGRLRLCFQPAEEICGGALPMIEGGVMDGVDRVFGIHLWSPLQAGKVAMTAGPVFGSADEIAIVVRGRGGHGGMPHLSIDPIVVAAEIVIALQKIVSRETSPFAPAVLTIGRIEAGSAFNVIAEEARMRGTVRALDHDIRERIIQRAEEVAHHIAAAAGATATLHRGAGCPPVVSDAGSADIIRRAALKTVGEDATETAQPITVGDDVAFFLSRAPGCYFLVGAGKPGAPVIPHHHPEFDIDEACLPIGAETMTRAALEVLA